MWEVTELSLWDTYHSILCFLFFLCLCLCLFLFSSFNLSTSFLSSSPSSILHYFLLHYPSFPSAALSCLPFIWALSSSTTLTLLFIPMIETITISADVFCNKGQRIWGEVGLGCMVKQQGSPSALLTKCQHAHSISPSPYFFCLLSSDLHHYHCSFPFLKEELGIELESSVFSINFQSLKNI